MTEPKLTREQQRRIRKAAEKFVRDLAKGDMTFEGVTEATGSDPTKLTRSAARTVGVALAEIAEAETDGVAGPCPPDILAKKIRRGAVLFRQRHPEWDLTPMSLAKWWPTCQETVSPEAVVTAREVQVGQVWEGDPPWVREGLTWEQWQRREDVGSDPGTSGEAPEPGPTPEEPPAEGTG